MYKPSPFIVAFEILNPTESKKVNGKLVHIYPESGHIIYGSFKSFGGTETIINDVLTLIDTANVETFYNPDITSLTRIKKLKDGKIYEILGTPENIEERNMYLKFKVKYIGSKV